MVTSTIGGLRAAYDDVAQATVGDAVDGVPARWVARPGSTEEVSTVLRVAAGLGLRVVARGRGTRLAWGVAPTALALLVDTSRMATVLAHVAGDLVVTGHAGLPMGALQRALAAHRQRLALDYDNPGGTIGDTIATAASGPLRYRYGSVRDLLIGITVVLADGTITRSGGKVVKNVAGYDLGKLYTGSLGTLGVITQAWLRLQERPRFRASASVRFSSFEAAWAACRGIAQAGLYPANCRLLDAREALVSGAGDGSSSLLIVTFESADHPVDTWLARSREIWEGFGGAVPDREAASAGEANRAGAAGRWRDAFLSGGHRHDVFVRLGVVMETFETAITWDRFEGFHSAVLEETRRAIEEVCGAPGLVSCRFAYVYADGPAPYYTVLAPGRPGQQVEQWAAIKQAASDVLNRLGGTITHHHAVGRYHRPWYDRQRPQLFASVLRAAKSALDPDGIMNPGVLIDPARHSSTPAGA